MFTLAELIRHLDSAKAVCPNTTKKGGLSVNTSAGAAMTFEAYSMIASKKLDIVNKPIFDTPNAFAAPSVCLPFDLPAGKTTRNVVARKPRRNILD